MSDQSGSKEQQKKQTSEVVFVFKDTAGNVVEAPEIDSGSITATSSDTAVLNVTSDNKGIKVTTEEPLEGPVTVFVDLTVDEVPWSGSVTFNVGNSPTELTLAAQEPNPTAPINSASIQRVGRPVEDAPTPYTTPVETTKVTKTKTTNKVATS